MERLDASLEKHSAFFQRAFHVKVCGVVAMIVRYDLRQLQKKQSQLLSIRDLPREQRNNAPGEVQPPCPPH